MTIQVEAAEEIWQVGTPKAMALADNALVHANASHGLILEWRENGLQKTGGPSDVIVHEDGDLCGDGLDTEDHLSALVAFAAIKD